MSLNFTGAVFTRLDMSALLAEIFSFFLFTSQPVGGRGFVDISTGCGTFVNLIHCSFMHGLTIGRNILKNVYPTHFVKAH